MFAGGSWRFSRDDDEVSGSGWGGPAVSFIERLSFERRESEAVPLWDFVGRGAIFPQRQEWKQQANK
jgi:hypothetical protein